MFQKSLITILVAIGLLLTGNALGHAAIMTIAFEGELIQSNSLFNSGDKISGSYSFDTAVASIPHPDTTFDAQTVAIDSTALPGTAWSLTIA